MVSRLMTSRRGTSIVPEDKTHLLMAKLEDGGEAFELTWDRSSQHTISWSKPLKLHVRSIPTVIAAGSCNLYAFPSVDGQTPSSAQIQVLVKMLTALVNDSIFDMPDSSGATPLLALLVANNSDAIDLSLMLYHARPILLEQAHLDGPFVGETALHIVAINRQEDALCKMLQLAHEHLNSEQLERVLRRSPDLTRRLCALYYHDFVCNSYELPAECQGAPDEWLGGAFDALMSDAPVPALLDDTPTTVH